ncbi:MAG TPA: amidohydrolase [Candidatus Saccharimonadales bacterium]|nr:amidohydrolase [Candidatus Saccharimonadales bacterium]
MAKGEGRTVTGERSAIATSAVTVPAPVPVEAGPELTGCAWAVRLRPLPEVAKETMSSEPTRREFLGSLAAVSLFPFEHEKPSLLLHNGNIVTVNDQEPRAQALAIARGKIIGVGSDADILNLAGPGVKKIDLGRKTVLPGFIDAYSHPAMAGLMHLRMVDCDLRSISAIQEALRERAAQTPAGQWVLGFKYDDTKTSDGRPLAIGDLNSAVPDHPVQVEHRGGHTVYVNSLGFAKAGIDERTPDPAGGKIDHDPVTGKLSGRAAESARAFFDKVIPLDYTRDDHRAGVRLISRMLAKTGITSATEAQGTPSDLLAYQDARDAGELLYRAYCFINYRHIDSMIDAGVRTGLGDEWVRVGAMKLVCDGSISERTARLSTAYEGRPNDYGILVMTEEELYTFGRKAHLAGWQIGTHANGDVGIDTALRVYERLQRENPRKDPRFRLEHCTVINDSLLARMKNLGAIPTPFSTYVYYHGEKMRYYGAERLNHMFALRSFLDAGIRATQASDYPPGEFIPMMALQSEVTRTDMKGNVWGPKQKITVEEAIRVGTINGAYASYEENLKGSLEVGKVADLVVLGRDPLKEDPSTLVSIPVERTMAGGRWSFES